MFGAFLRSPLGIVAIGLIAVFFIVGVGGSGLSTGYLSGTQGLEAQFHSVRWHNNWYSSTEEPGEPLYEPVEGVDVGWPSSMTFGYDMVLDPDYPISGMPDLCASQQPLTVQTDVEPKQYVWNYKVESDKVLENGTIVDVYKQFEMYRYRCDWAINVWLSGTEMEAEGKVTASPLTWVLWGPNYAGGVLWLRLVPKSFVYFVDNPDQVFFAPAYIGLSEDVEWVGLDKDGRIIENDPDILQSQDLVPKTQGETVGIYYERGGGEELNEQTLLSYQGTALDPQIFRDEYWIRVKLVEFKPLSWTEGIWPFQTHNWKYPSAHFKFMVYLFVVGEWTVYFKTGEIPELEPHTPIVGLAGWWDWLSAWLRSPFGLFYSFIGLIVLGIIALIVLSIFAPGLLVGIGRIFKTRYFKVSVSHSA